MSITSELVPLALLRRVAGLTAAGSSNAAIAATLISEGFSVPRENADYRLFRYPHGHVFATELATPGRWTAAAVTELLACPEASSTNNFAAARAKLGSDAVTTLTVT